MNRPKQDFINRLVARCGLMLFSFCLTLCFPQDALATTPNAYQQINQAIEQYSSQLLSPRYQDYQLQIRPIDQRMQLSPCQSPLAISHRPANRMSGRLTMKVSCAGPDNWGIHVPVTIKAFDQVVIAIQPIPKDTQLTALDVKLESRDVTLLHSGYYKDLTQVVGQVSKRPIREDQVVNSAILQPAMMVDRGEKVVIFAEGKGLSIRTTGVAMQQGVHGELIRVKNSKTNKVVEGRISGPGQVKVSL